MNLSVAVQHHPLRAHLIEPLVTALGGAEVVTDPNPDSPVRSPLRCYLECLRRTPADATHRLIVQDDAWPCDNFRERALAALAEHPDALVAFFVPGLGPVSHAVKRALKRDLPWAELPVSWTPTVALAWPHEAAQSFLAYAEAKYDVERIRGDDGPVGAWRQENRHVKAWAPVPSLVQHPDVEPSIFRRMPGRAGQNRARVAAAPPA